MKTSLSTIRISKDFPQINSIHEKVIKGYSSTIKAVNKDADRLQLGVCLQILKSVYTHLLSLKLLLENCYLESAGAVATSLWEKSILLQYISIDPIQRVNIYVNHETIRKLPWNVKEMVKGIVDTEKVPRGKTMADMVDLFYIQYSYLCCIKHGNPYTLSYINRHIEDENFFEPKPLISNSDKDIAGFLFLVANNSLIETLNSFAKNLCSQEQYLHLKHLLIEITNATLNINLELPQILKTSVADFRPEFWDYLVDLDKRHSR